MINYPGVMIIGLGHRARNGKDTVAKMLKEQLQNVEIIHWADGVYEECENKNSDYPLIKKEFVTTEKDRSLHRTFYSVLDKKLTGARIAISSETDPFLHNFFAILM